MSIEEQYPLMFDNDVLKYPDGFDIQEVTVENVNQTEAGTDQIQLVRTGKIKISISTTCLSNELILFKTYSRIPKFNVKYYDAEAHGYVTKAVRMRGLKYPPLKSSFKLENVDGVYNVSFTLEEF